ncbi:MAG: histidine kinase dimerization/phosphoacceptor domain -containing protein [Methanotrichaceae archaeon]
MKSVSDTDNLNPSSPQMPIGTIPILDLDFANQIVESAGQSLLITGENWRFYYVNPAFAKLVGCSTEDLIGKSLEDFACQEDLGLINDARIKQLAGETITCEARLIRSDGKIVYVQITGTPRWYEGKVVGSFTVITNLTDHYTAELEQRVYERTAELAKTNEILLIEIVERRRAEERLIMSLEEKEILLREIHRKVKNNLQLISSLLCIQSKKAIDERPLDIIRDFQNRVKSMAIVHDKLCNSQDLAKVNLDEYVKSLVDSLYQLYNVSRDRIDMTLDVDKIVIGVDTAVACGFVINEIVSNSLKHAFPGDRKGEINLEFHSEGENGFRMIIKDNGIGFKKDLAKFNALGLQLVSAVMKHIDGSIKLDSAGGTRLEIAFRVPIYGEYS